MQTHTHIHLCFNVGFHQPFLFCNTSPESSTCSCFSARARLHTTMSPTHVRNTVQPQVQFFTHSTFHRLQFSQTTLFTDSTFTHTSPLGKLGLGKPQPWHTNPTSGAMKVGIASGSLQGLEQHMKIEGPRENTSNGKNRVFGKGPKNWGGVPLLLLQPQPPAHWQEKAQQKEHQVKQCFFQLIFGKGY